MKNHLFLLSSLFLCFLCSGERSIQAIETSPSPTVQPIKIPDPRNLNSKWMKYFDTDPENIDKRIDLLSESLNDLSKKISVLDDEKLSPLFKRVIADLEAYKVERKNIPLQIAKPLETPKENYTLEGLDSLGNELFLLKSSNEDFRLQLAIEEEKNSQEKNFLDKLFTSYQETQELSAERLSVGLKIMSLSLQIEVDRYLTEHTEAKIEKNTKENQQIKERLKVARNRLVLLQESVAPIESTINTIETSLSSLQNSVDELQKNYIQASQEKKSQLRQEFLSASTKESLARASLILTETKKEFFLLENAKTKKSLSEIHSIIAKQKDAIKEQEKQLAIWKAASLLEFERSLQPEKAATELVIQKLTQETLTTVEALEKELFLAKFFLDQLTFLLKEKYTSFGEKIRNGWHSFIEFFEERAEFMNTGLFKIGSTKITPWLLIKLLIYIGISYFLAAGVRRSIQKYGKKQRRVSQTGLYAISRLAFYSIFFVGIIISVATIGIDFTAFAVIAGALSVGIGFGLQSIFNNFISGIILLLEKTLRVGDFIEIEAGKKGMIKEIRVRSTIIRTYDNLEIIVPNFDLISKNVINWTLTEKARRVHVPFAVAFGSDKDQVRELIVAAAKKVPITLADKEPDVWLMRMGDNGLEFELIVWVNEHLQGLPAVATMARYLWIIENTLLENGIEIPYPVRDVRIKT